MDDDISSSFINKFTKAAHDLIILGDPMNPETNLGPIADLETIQTLKEHIEDTVDMGGELLLGGNENTDESGKGRFFEPTIIANG